MQRLFKTPKPLADVFAHMLHCAPTFCFFQQRLSSVCEKGCFAPISNSVPGWQIRVHCHTQAKPAQPDADFCCTFEHIQGIYTPMPDSKPGMSLASGPYFGPSASSRHEQQIVQSLQCTDGPSIL